MSADKQDYIAELQNVEYPTKYLLNFLFKCIFPFYKRFKKKDIYYLVLRIPKYLYITHFTFLTKTIFLYLFHSNLNNNISETEVDLISL